MTTDIPKAAVDLIKEFEQFEAMAYVAPEGGMTIGYGTTAAAGVGIVPVPGMVITESQATRYLMAYLKILARQIRPKIVGEINDNQWSAFLSLAYNIGPGAFLKSTALREFNRGNHKAAADAILMFSKSKGRVLKGLVRRRQRERSLFLTPPVPWWVRVLRAILGLLGKGRR